MSNTTMPPVKEDTTTKVQEDHSSVLNSISPGRIAFAAAIGLMVIVYMFVSKFDAEQFKQIDWNMHVFLGIAGAAFFMVFRHFCYMTRLRIITDGFFSWKKCFEMIIMWEFSSAVTPTSVGGAAVAMFAISQEKLSAGKTAMIVLYTVVVDTFSFLTALLFFYVLFGTIMIQPNSPGLSELMDSQWGYGFVVAYSLMFIYGSMFFYGVLINPKGLQRILLTICKIPFLKRFEAKAVKMTNDMELASKALKTKNWTFHLGSYLTTMGAWASRFMVLNCLIFVFVATSPNPEVQAHYNDFFSGDMEMTRFMEEVFIYARQQAMYVIMAVMPTPGGAGAAEAAFETFHFDYIPTDSKVIPMAGTLLFIMAFIWRFFTYYIYLFVGAIVVPNWVRKIIARNQAEHEAGQ